MEVYNDFTGCLFEANSLRLGSDRESDPVIRQMHPTWLCFFFWTASTKKAMRITSHNSGAAGHQELHFPFARPTMKSESRPARSAMPEAVIVSAVRTPVGRAYKGSLRATRPDDLAALAIKE